MKSKKTISEQNPDARLRANTPDLPLNSTPPRRTTPPSPPRRTTPPPRNTTPPRRTTPPVPVRPNPPITITPPENNKSKEDLLYEEFGKSLIGKILLPINVNVSNADETQQRNLNGIVFKIVDVLTHKKFRRTSIDRLKITLKISLTDIEDKEKLGIEFPNDGAWAKMDEDSDIINTLVPIRLFLQDPKFYQFVKKNLFDKVNSISVETPLNENKNTKKKVIRLTETQVKNLIGKIVEESVMGKEPIKDITNWRSQFIFKSGTANPIYLSGPINQQGSGLTPNWRPYDPQTDFDIVVKTLVGWFQQNDMVNVLKQYRKGGLPKFITIGAGTSSTGSDVTNASVGTQRLVFLEKVVTEALIKMGVDAQYVKSFISRDGAAEYTPTQLDRDFFNKQRVEEDIMERFGVIQVNKLEIRGLNRNQMRDVQFGLNTASSQINTWVFDGVDEDLIVKNIKKLDSWDDVKELSQDIGASARWSSLEAFINDQLFDDPSQMRYVSQHLTNLAINSQLPRNTVRIVGDKISIGL